MLILLSGKVPIETEQSHSRALLDRFLGFFEHRYKRRVAYRSRVRIRVIGGAVFLAAITRLGLHLNFDLRWSTEDARTTGDYFPIMVLARVLSTWGHRGKISVSVVEPPNRFWEEIANDTGPDVLASWQELAALVYPTFQFSLEKVARSTATWKSKRFHPLQGILAPVFTDGLLTELYRVSRTLGLSTEGFLLDEMGYGSSELAHRKLPANFVAWHVRRNLSYSTQLGEFRNLSESEIEEELSWLLSRFQLPVVLLSSKSGCSHVREIVEKSPIFSPDEKARLITRSLGFLDGMRVGLACTFYFQRWGGGMGMPIIYSQVPYFIIQPKMWPIHPTPWQHSGQRVVSTGMLRAPLSQLTSEFTKDVGS